MSERPIARRAKIILLSAGAAALVLACLWTSGSIGVLRKSAIEADARNTSAADVLSVQSSYGDTLTVLVFYDPQDPDGSRSRAVVYENRTGLYRSGLSLGWFFRSGGPAGRGVSTFTTDNCKEAAYYSSNTEGFVRAEFADGREAAVLDPGLPIALVADCDVTFYTADGEAFTAMPGWL